MSPIEDRLRSLLDERASAATMGVEPPSGFLSRVRRRRVRNATAIVATVALIVAGSAFAFNGDRSTAIPPADRHEDWVVYDYGRFTLRYPPHWFVADTIFYGGGVMIANLPDAQELVQPDAPRHLVDRLVSISLSGHDDIVLPAPDVPDTVLPVSPSPSANPHQAGVLWSQPISHNKVEYEITIAGGPAASNDDLQIAIDIARTLQFKDATKPPKPASLEIDGIASLAAIDADHAWALVSLRCEFGKEACPVRLFSTSDGGRSWEQMRIPESYLSVPEGSTAKNVIGRVWFLNTNEGWLTGDSAFVTRDGGKTWAAYPSPPSVVSVSGTAKRLWEVSGDCPERVIASCEVRIRASSDRGRTWSSPRKVDGGNGDTKIARFNDQHAIAYTSLVHGAFFSLIEETRDGGRTWRSIDTPVECSGESISADFAVAAGRGILVCGGEPATQMQFKTVWRLTGTRWTKIAEVSLERRIGLIPVGGHIGRLSTTPGGRLWLALNRSPLIWSDDAINWTASTLGGDGEQHVTAPTFTDEDHGWATQGTDVWTTADSGRTWQRHPLPSRADS